MKIATWNLSGRGVDAAASLGALIRQRELNLLLLQEAVPDALPAFARAAGLDWIYTAYDAGATRSPDNGRGLVAAIGGRGAKPASVGYLPQLSMPERMVFIRVSAGLSSFTAASYDAPGSRGWEVRNQQAEVLLDWVHGVHGPLLVGSDANAPVLDHPDPDLARVAPLVKVGATGTSRLEGIESMFGARPKHDLEDIYRRWLLQNPGLLQHTAIAHPSGPLAVSHYAGEGKDSLGQPKRFDAIWVCRSFSIFDVAYEYEPALAAGADHALLVAEVECVDCFG